MLRIILFNIASIILLIGCSEMIDIEDSTINFDQQKVDSLSSLIEGYKIIPLSNQKDYLTKQILKIQSENQKLFVLDRQSMSGRILIFDENGKAATKIDSEGRGPGEYIQIADFDLNLQEKEVIIADPANKKILRFSYSGTHLGSKSVNHWIKNIDQLYLENNDPIVVTSTLGSHSTTSGDNYDLFVFDSNMNLKSKGLPFEKSNEAGMGNGFNFYETSNGVNYYRTFTDTVYQIDRKGKLRIVNTLKFPAEILPKDKVLDHMIGKIPLSKYVYFVSYFENNAFITFTYSWNGKDYIGIYDKLNKQSKVAQVPKLPSCNECLGLNLVGAEDHFFIAYSNPKAVNELLEIIDPLGQKCLNSSALPAIEHLQEDDNSIIILMNFK